MSRSMRHTPTSTPYLNTSQATKLTWKSYEAMEPYKSRRHWESHSRTDRLLILKTTGTGLALSLFVLIGLCACLVFYHSLPEDPHMPSRFLAIGMTDQFRAACHLVLQPSH